MDASRERAGAFARTLFSGPPRTAAEVQAMINGSGDFTIATNSANGRPHAALTIGACVDGVIHFTSTDTSLLAKNLRREPEVALTCQSVMAAGRARAVCRCSSPGDLAALLRELCEKVTATPGFDGTLWAVELRRLIL